jgi:hypothetical protein
MPRHRQLEPAVYLIQPRIVRKREVQLESRPLCHPLPVNRSSEFRHVLPGFSPAAWKLDPAAKSQRCSSVFLPYGIQALP